MPRRANRITTGVSIAVTVLVIALTASYLDWNDAGERLRNAKVAWLLAALAFFTLNYGLRTLRFRLLLNPAEDRFTPLLAVTTLHGLFNYLLPAKSGELSYLLLAKNHLNVSVPESTATLIVARFFDFGVIAALLPFAVLAFHRQLPGWLVLSSVLYVTAIAVAGAGLLLYLRRTERRPDVGVSWWHRLRTLVADTLQGLRVIDRRRQYLRLWLLTFGIWGCVLMNYYCITASLGYEPVLGHMVMISVIIIPLSLVPTQGVANLGTHEAAWVAALSLFGYSLDDALNLAVTSHVVLFAMFLLLGLVGFLIARRATATRLTE